MMDVLPENLLTQFLRTQCGPFTVKEIVSGLSTVGLKVQEQEIQGFLDSNPSVFVLQDGTYVTRAGAFTDSFFSIKPHKFEVQGGFLLPGHRCIPFVDSENVSGTIDFLYGNVLLPHKVMEFQVRDVLPLFTLFGEEYALQYMMADPACDKIDFSGYDEEIPQKVKLTVTDMSAVYVDCDFKNGDVFLATVVDWDKSIVKIHPLHEYKTSPFEQLPLDKKRTKWYDLLEEALLDSFNIYGPCVSIEDQLAKVFFTYHERLCVPSCGTIEQGLKYFRKVGLELYGVETRLWFKGQDVPAVGAWMLAGSEEVDSAPQSKSHIYGTIPYSPVDFPLLKTIVDSFILDLLYQKRNKEDISVKDLLPESCNVTESQLRRMNKFLSSRKEQLEKEYNWFADFELGEIRHSLLILHQKIALLIFELDSATFALESMPQQPLVILTQLLSHARVMLETLLHSGNDEFSKEEIQNFAASLEGMEYNFEGVSLELKSALEVQRKKQFSIVKK
ncbi:MAG: hypothetical protein J6B81_05055 [Spirochaetaceae bacterium]|nr:hypothetical protein [Spirochaetaceae bacterium]